ncbi:hypothetical protein Tco_1316825 [Tanacetum coccineum]
MPPGSKCGPHSDLEKEYNLGVIRGRFSYLVILINEVYPPEHLADVAHFGGVTELVSEPSIHVVIAKWLTSFSHVIKQRIAAVLIRPISLNSMGHMGPGDDAEDRRRLRRTLLDVPLWLARDGDGEQSMLCDDDDDTDDEDEEPTEDEEEEEH